MNMDIEMDVVDVYMHIWKYINIETYQPVHTCTHMYDMYVDESRFGYIHQGHK
jgi:hypothetical protein